MSQQSGVKPAGSKVCFEVPKHPNLQDSWGCCVCKTLNGTQRPACKECGHKRCDRNPANRPS